MKHSLLLLVLIAILVGTIGCKPEQGPSGVDAAEKIGKGEATTREDAMPK